MDKEHAYMIDELIMDVLTGNAERSKQDELKKWLAASEANRIYFEHLREIWFSAACSSDNQKFDENTAFKSFQQRVRDTQQKVLSSRYHSIKRHLWQTVKYAAVILLVVGVGRMAYLTGKQQANSSLEPIEIITPTGAQTRISLPDGTQVMLNAGSKLVYNADFGQKNREVILTGEGYFEVTHRAKMPFYVHSTDFRVKVLGTKFNICNYPDEKQATVSLLEGRVSLNECRQPNKQLILNPDEQAVWDKTSAQLSKHTMPSDSDERTWWKDWLVFKDCTLEHIVQVLQRNYDIRIKIEEDCLRTMQFNAEFRRSQSIETILDRLQATGKLFYNHLNGNYYIYKNN